MVKGKCKSCQYLLCFPYHIGGNKICCPQCGEPNMVESTSKTSTSKPSYLPLEDSKISLTLQKKLHKWSYFTLLFAYFLPILIFLIGLLAFLIPKISILVKLIFFSLGVMFAVLIFLFLKIASLFLLYLEEAN